MIYWTLSAQEEMVYRAHRVLFDNFAHQSSNPVREPLLVKDSISTIRFFQKVPLMTTNTPKRPTSISLLHLKKRKVAYVEPARLSS